MRAPDEKNLHTTCKDRVDHVEKFIDWDTLGKVRSVDKESYATFLEETVGNLFGRVIAQRAPELDKSKYAHKDGELILPDEAKANMDDLVENFLVCPSVSAEYGGMGLPHIMNTLILEMLFQADAGWGNTPGLQGGVAELIEMFGTEEQKQTYLPGFVSGEKTGSMDLTEPGAGSDLGGVITKATEADGKITIRGNKIFITSPGDVHLVLARDADTYDATSGKMEGLSVYIVPKTIDGKRNNVEVTGLEHKLGINSSPTCSVAFDEAEGFLLGEKGKGMKYMFMLMNGARLAVAAQALGLITAAAQDAKAYALDREQGRPIAEFSLVKDMLKDMQMYSEAIRSIVYTASFSLDMEHNMKGDDGYKVWANRAAVLVPLIKYYAAEKAVELTKKAVQVFGGAGYTKDQNVEKYFRDAMITPIYEGTSEIQVSLFVKEAMKGKFGLPSRANVVPMLEEMNNDLEGMVGDLEEPAQNVRESSKKVLAAMDVMGAYSMQTMQDYPPFGDQQGLLTQAKRLSEMTVETYGAYLLLKQAQVDEGKKVVAKRFVSETTPHINMLAEQIGTLNTETVSEYDAIIDCI